MSRYFAFRTDVQLAEGVTRDVLVVCQGMQKFESPDLTAAIEKALEEGALPDDVVILVPENCFDELVEAGSSDTLLQSALLRGNTIWSRLVIGIDGYGMPSKNHQLGGVRPIENEFVSKILDALVLKGLAHIAIKQEVVKRAPAGCVFAKPSGEISEIFLLAADLLHSEPEITLIAWAVLRQLGGYLDDVRTIYVDTMAIQPLARAIVHLASQGGRNVVPTVESFHSYDGLVDLRVEAPDSLICIMSASTSGSLAKKFSEKSRCSPKRIITCLDVVDERPDSKVLINAGKLFNISLTGASTVGANRVQLAGEFFASTAKPPRQVILGVKHDVLGLKKFCVNLVDKGVFCLDYMPPRAPSPRPIAVDGDVLLAHPKFVEWFERRIGWSVPASTKWIVYADDVVSEKMARFAHECLVRLGVQDVVTPINAAQLAAQSPIQTTDGILVCSAVVRSGTQLISISRDLRTFAPNSPRNILVGVAIPPTAGRFKVTQSNLTKGNQGWDYAVAVWMTAAVGHADGMSSWDEERRLLQSAAQNESDEKQFSEWVQLRFGQISRTGGPNKNDILLALLKSSEVESPVEAG